jgi:hypothetical protein
MVRPRAPAPRVPASHALLGRRLTHLPVVAGARPPPAQLIAWLDPFRRERLCEAIDGRPTLEELVERLPRRSGLPFEIAILIGGEAIPVDRWRYIRPRPGCHVLMVPRLTGGGGALRLIAGLAIAALAVAASAFTFGALSAPLGIVAAGLIAGGIGAAVSIGGTLALNALIPPASSVLKPLDTSTSPTYAITGSQNQIIPWGVIARVYGKHRITPALGAKPFTELVGNDQYLRQLFVWSYGPCILTDVRIGTTPLDQFQEVTREDRLGYLSDTPLTLFPGVVDEQDFSIGLDVGVQNVRTTSTLATEYSIDLSWPQGLYRLENNPPGKRNTAEVGIRIEQSPTGLGTWTIDFDQRIRQAQASPLRLGFRFSLPAQGAYDIRVTMTFRGSGDNQYVTTTFWTALRSIEAREPINFPGLTKTAIRILATEQLNGVVNELNGVVSSILRDWNGSAWVEQETANPASVYRDVLQGSGNARPLADGRIDLAAIQAWHVFCDSNNMEFNGVFDDVASVYERLRSIAATGRGFPAQINGRWSVIWDYPGRPLAQLFTIRNVRNFAVDKPLVRRPHAYRVRFINRDKDWQSDERIVPVDGFTEETAVLYETREDPYVTASDRVFKDTIYDDAQARLRPENITFETDWEYLACTVGDLVQVQHDVMFWGSGAGRIKALTVSAGIVEGFVLDEKITLPAMPVVVRQRYADGSQAVRQIVEQLIVTDTVTLSDFIALVDAPAVGDLVAIGQQGIETVSCVVQKIEPQANLSARLTLVEAAENIHLADTGEVPPFVSRITLPPGDLVPAIEELISDERVLRRDTDGNLRPVILVVLRPSQQRPVAELASIEIDYRDVDTVAWRQEIAPPDSTQVVLRDVETPVVYEIRARFIYRTGRAGPWFGPILHQVVGLTGLPPDVLTGDVEGDFLIWRYPTQPPDFAGFEVRWSPDVTVAPLQATPAHDGLLSDTSFDLRRISGTVAILFVWALDTTGNRSLNALAVLRGNAPGENFQTVTTSDQAPAWTGALTDGTVAGGDLVSDDASMFYPEPAMQDFYRGAPTDPFFTVSLVTLSYRFAYVVAGTAEASDRIGATVVATGDWTLYYREGASTSDDPADYLPVSGRIVATPGETITFLLLARGTVTSLVISHLAPERSQTFDGVAILSASSRITAAAGVFRAIRAVIATIHGGVGASVQVLDRNAVSGPLVQLLTSAGAGVSGVIDAQLVGY